MTQIIVTTPEELSNLIQHGVRKALSEQGAQQTTEADKLLSIDEAANFLNLARQTLYGFTSKQLIPFIKRGKKLYFSKPDLEKWLLEGKHKTVFQIKSELEGGQQ